MGKSIGLGPNNLVNMADNLKGNCPSFCKPVVQCRLFLQRLFMSAAFWKFSQTSTPPILADL